MTSRGRTHWPAPAPPGGRRRFGAVVRVERRDPGGRVSARRRAGNAVLESGALLVADLFRGGPGGAVTHMTVGADPTPEVPPFTTPTLAVSHPETGELTGERDVAVAVDGFTVTVQADEHRIALAARVVLPGAPDGLRGPVAEAALVHISGDGERRLYNRVTFEPLDKRADQELSLYWEVFFPYGHPD